MQFQVCPNPPADAVPGTLFVEDPLEGTLLALTAEELAALLGRLHATIPPNAMWELERTLVTDYQRCDCCRAWTMERPVRISTFDDEEEFFTWCAECREAGIEDARTALAA